jgi:Protein of unknown function (DUF1360)
VSTVTAEPAASARPLPEYAALVTVFGAAVGGFLVLARSRLPERVGFGDLARLGLASYKVGRLVAKDEVTTWVRAPVTRDEEATEPEREGMARALGELVTCPYCIDVWVSAGLTGALALRPRETRLVTTVFRAQAVADFLNAVFVRVRGDS